MLVALSALLGEEAGDPVRAFCLDHGRFAYVAECRVAEFAVEVVEQCDRGALGEREPLVFGEPEVKAVRDEVHPTKALVDERFVRGITGGQAVPVRCGDLVVVGVGVPGEFRGEDALAGQVAGLAEQCADPRVVCDLGLVLVEDEFRAQEDFAAVAVGRALVFVSLVEDDAGEGFDVSEGGAPGQVERGF
ncbi:hypothetical protein, partial [Streptomyces sp900116325]|uniref:hypothetical protein n=1 Tax=Streptomyces sp. 900116325 TaxID=3154295 RepID=UPI003406BABA